MVVSLSLGYAVERDVSADKLTKITCTTDYQLAPRDPCPELTARYRSPERAPRTIQSCAHLQSFVIQQTILCAQIVVK